MAIRIKFDNSNNVIQPTFVLTTRGGNRIRVIPATNVSISDGLNESSKINFEVNKADCADLGGTNAGMTVWDYLVDFKLIWVKEWNRLFECSVNINESDVTVKNVSAIALGESELSQILLHNVNINNETDILREDYSPSVLYSQDASSSILNRILEKAPHYSIGHVDASVSGIQRTFTFDGKSIYDAMQEIAEEIKCLFVIDCSIDTNGNITRVINVYDLESHCVACGERGDFVDKCTNCGSDNVVPGYGEDTTVFVSTDNLANSIEYSTDVGAVKNCFRLKAGDDLMTATIANCNPNGSSYIWYISEDTKKDMSKELVEKINNYDRTYSEYYTSHESYLDSLVVADYNSLISKYGNSDNGYHNVVNPVVGFPALMQALYDAIDLKIYLQSSMMPTPEILNTSAEQEALKLEHSGLTYIAVRKATNVSLSTVNSSALLVAKSIVDNRYQVKAVESSYSNSTWSGKFVITSYSDDNDTFETRRLSYPVTSDFDKYVRQLINNALGRSDISEETDVIGMFKLDDVPFKIELGRYSHARLESILNACQTCINILTENGVSNNNSWLNSESSASLYEELYLPMYNKLGYIESELVAREREIEIVDQLMGNITDLRNNIHNDLNFESYLGDNLWQELCSYRREDEYSNENYISDGLDNAALIKNAMQFLNVANKEIFKSATLQHSITASIRNLLAINGFEPIVEHFEVGNWIRIRSDGVVYKLRLIGYQLSFDNIDSLSVTFSDVKTTTDGYSDIEDILNQASSMASSYSYVAHQAKKGSDGTGVLDNWVENGLDLTNMKIVNNADNQSVSWDTHGILCREYIPEYDAFDDRQLKIINRGLYLTDDAWRTSRAGIGDFMFYNPKSGEIEESYGIIADTLVGNLVLSKEVGIYNESGSITLDDLGLTVTADKTVDDSVTPTFVVQKKYLDQNDEEQIQKMLYMDTEGNVILNASAVKIFSSSDPTNMKPLDDIANVDVSGITDSVISSASELIQTNNEIMMGVLEGYSKVSDIESLRQDFETSLSILPDKVAIQVSESTEQRFVDFENNFQEQIDNITAHYRFTADGQYIGLEGSDAIMRLFNDVMQIIVSGNVATEVDRNGLTATVANILTLFLGDYTLKYNPQDGHLTLT